MHGSLLIVPIFYVSCFQFPNSQDYSSNYYSCQMAVQHCAQAVVLFLEVTLAQQACPKRGHLIDTLRNALILSYCREKPRIF
jgi:hypothetical protein